MCWYANADDPTTLASPLRFALMSARKTPNHLRRSFGIGDDHSQSDSDMADLIGVADSALFSTPSRNPMDISAYLIPDEPQAQTVTKNTPVSLESVGMPFDEESREVSALLDYLNDLALNCPLRRAVDAFHRAPDPSGALASTGDMTTSTPASRAIPLRAPAPLSTLRDRDRLTHTWSSGVKPTFRYLKTLERVAPQRTKAREGASGTSHRLSTSRTESTMESSPGEETKCVNVEDRDELELDHSLQELLEMSVDATSPQKQTREFSEEEWQRLEQVQQMAEVLLREAEYERESVRAWSKNMQEYVARWVLEQRALEEARVRAGEDELKAMRDALNRLQRDTEDAASHHELVKQKLQAVIQQQADKISILEEKLKVAEKSALVLKTPHEAITRHTLRSSLRTSRISLSPTWEKCRVERQANVPSPVTVMDPITPTRDAALPDSIPSPESMSFTPRIQRARSSLLDGGKLVFYRNGTEKETRPDGTCVIRFPNGDVKCTLESESAVAYFHAKEKVRSSVQVHFLST